MDDTLLVDRPAPGVTLLTFNRPDVMNAIDMALAQRFDATLDALEHDEHTRCIVVTGAGDRAFSSGFDIHEIAGFDPGAMMNAFVTRDPIFWKVASHSRPIIAALNGVTYGAGALLACAADIRIGCPSTRFKVTASSYGAANATWTLPRIVGPVKAKEILMMGLPIAGEQMAQIGLLNRIVEDGAVVDHAIEMARVIAANPPVGVQAVKSLVDAGQGLSFQDAYRAEFAWMVESVRASSQSGSELFSGFLAKTAAR